MTDIKQVNINVPITKVKKERKTRKTEKVVKGGDPLPVLSTIRVGGQNPDIKPHVNKPTLNINIPKVSANVEPVKKTTPNAVKIVNSKKTQIRKPNNEQTKIHIQPNKRRNFTLKRKFSSKNVTIQVENENTIAQSRQNVENKINIMNEDEINQKLIMRGLMRPKANPPLKWKKNMLRDIMLFPARL